MEADIIVSCPYNPAHRIRKFKLMQHMSKCKKTSNIADKAECPLDKTHIVDRARLKEHIASCSSLGKLINVDPGFEIPKVDVEPSVIVNQYNSTENWEEEPEVPPYNPMEVSSKKPVLRCVSGLTKSERKRFRENERMRIANLKGFSSASAASSSTQDTIDEVPLRPPRDTVLSPARFLQDDFDKSSQMHDHVHDTNMQATFVTEFPNNTFHRILYDELAPEDDDIKQVEPPLRKTDTKMRLRDYFQHERLTPVNKENGKISISDKNKETKVKKTETAATSQLFNIDDRKKERAECMASTSSVSGERVTDKLLALLKNGSSAKKVQPMEETINLEQTNNDLGEKGPALDEINERLTHLVEIQNAAAEESVRLLQQLKELKLRDEIASSK